jgi:hypothetical protein
MRQGWTRFFGARLLLSPLTSCRAIDYTLSHPLAPDTEALIEPLREGVDAVGIHTQCDLG